MNGVVNKLYDIDSIVIPEELLQFHVDEQQVEAEVQRLSVRYAKESPAEVVSKGDLVYCQADSDSYPDGRTVLIYTGLQIPGAEQAEEAVVGKKVGEVCQTVLAGKSITLTITKVLHRSPVEVTDELVASIGVDGVTTVDDYRQYIREKMRADQEMEQSKEIIRHFLNEMTEKTSYTYDEAEMDAYVKDEMEKHADEMPEEDEISPDEIRKGIASQMKQRWMAEAFCKERGVDVDLSFVEEDADRMIEMMQLMGEEVPDRAEMIEMATQDAYFGGLMQEISKIIEEKMGGSYGNR